MVYNNTTFPDHPDMGGQQPPSNNGGGSDFPRYQGGGGQPNNGGQSNGGWQGNNRQWGDNGGGQKKPWNGGGGGSGGGNWGGQKKSWNGGGGGNRNWGNKSNEPQDLTLYMPYAVTGNPNPPDEVCRKIEAIVKRLATLGYTLRTGGVPGLEEVAERAAPERQELHLPWRGFAEKDSKYTFTEERAKAIAKQFSPVYDTVKPSAQTFMAKGVRLIMGQKVNSPALFLLIWTEDGAETPSERSARTGFSTHPIAVANALGIRIFNFGKPDAEARFNKYIEGVHPSVPQEQNPSNQSTF